MSGQSHLLQADKKGPFRLLRDLYSTDNSFRGFVEFAVIGAVALFFIHGYQSVPMIGKAAKSAVSPAPTAHALPDPGDIVKFARRGNLAPRLNELGLDETYFANDPEPLRSQLTEAWRAYRNKDPNKALELLQPAAADHPHVLLVRGLATMARPEDGMLRGGSGLLEQAAGKSDPKSMAVLGVLHIIGTPGLQHDLEKGQKLILGAATQGDVDAARVAGQGYLSGWMGSIDPGRAAKYFGFAADRGDSRATLFLADLHYTGRGVAKDELEGDRLAEKAAGQGDAEAQAMVGTRRMQAYMAGITDDPSEALKWLNRAAERNEHHAVELLANFYISFGPRNGKPDVAKGLEILKRCVDQSSNASCAMAYANALDNGLGGVRDVKAIYALYQRANRDGGNDKARARIAELGKELSTTDRIQVEMESTQRPVRALLKCKFGEPQPC
ncbi:MAG: sel1 repeat family protein [Bradyrhizobium sp.]|nr:sel1 repeat family protein [Bradyrhizobium sp.]